MRFAGATCFLFVALSTASLACGGGESDGQPEPGESAWWDENADKPLDEADHEDLMEACTALEEEVGYAEAFCEYGAVIVAAATSDDDESFQQSCAAGKQGCLDEPAFNVSLCFDTTTLSPDCEAVVGDFRDCLTENTASLEEFGTCESSHDDIGTNFPELLPSCERLLLCQE